MHPLNIINNLVKPIVTLQFVPCHRKKSRSFMIFGKQFPICARCTSILLGYLFIPILFAINFNSSIIIGMLLNTPMIVDGYTQLKGWRKSNNSLRFTTGLLSGIGQAMIIQWSVLRIVNFLV